MLGVIVVYLNPRTTPFGKKIEFTPKYIIVGVEVVGGVRIIFKGAILIFLIN